MVNGSANILLALARSKNNGRALVGRFLDN